MRMCDLDQRRHIPEGAALTSVQDAFTRVEPHDVLSVFRLEFYDALAARADGLFELVDAVLCAEGAVKSLVELSLVPEHRRGSDQAAAWSDAPGSRSDRGRVCRSMRMSLTSGYVA